MKRINIFKHVKNLIKQEMEIYPTTPLPSYKDYYNQNFTELVDAIKFYYDVDIDNFIGDPWDIVAQVAENPHWLEEFHAEFEEYLREREYIQ